MAIKFAAIITENLAKVQPLVAQIGWSHNLVILQRCKGSQEREFYIRMTQKFGWSKNVLVHQIDNQSYVIDLLLYHRRLKCLVALELKIGEFQPEFVGKMQFYLTALDKQVRDEFAA